MRLCARPGELSLHAATLLLLFLLLASVHVGANNQTHQGRKRHYYIAAVEIDWNYQGNDMHGFLPPYKKVVFREYEKDFTRAKIHPPWLGLLGPTLRGEEGDTIVVTFRNMATQPCSLHPHGIAYGKQSEGAHYFDNTSQKEKEDDVVRPNREHVYNWEVTPEVSPKPDDPACLTYSYVSHKNVVEDFNAGLVGTLLVCKHGSLDETGKQSGVNQELVFLFGVFDERKSIHKPSSFYDDSEHHLHYTINGYTKGALPGLSVCAYSSISLHLLGMSSEPELFSVHMNGQVLQHMGHKVSALGLISGSSATASMVPVHTGRWMLSSHVVKHIEVGMHAFVDVKECEAFKAPRRKMTLQQKRDSKEWKYYIAAEEVFWDYAPKMPKHIDESYKSQYLRQSSTRIGRKYKKVVYTLYNDESFTERKENKQQKSELGILGPVIRAQIRDVIKIVFKNMASRPYSIYPHGLTIKKSQEGVNYPEGGTVCLLSPFTTGNSGNYKNISAWFPGNHSHAVQPGNTHTYEWKVVEEDEPLKGDPRCLTRIYHSAVDTPRDIASGLIGPLLICKSQSLNVRNVQVKADKEQQAMFAVFDENKSWYLDDNIRAFCDPSRVNKADPGFYKSNVMHTINGYVYESGPLLGFCNGDVAKWHVTSVGAQDYIQTATAYGHTFELNKRKEDILSLYPMTGETITMNMENIGVWLMVSLNSHGTTKGMRLRFQDVECFRDHHYEYNYDEPEKKYDLLKPLSLDEIKKKEAEKEKQRLQSSTHAAGETDHYTELFAKELGLRTLTNKLKEFEGSVEKLDLSFLDYDAIDVLEGKVRNATLMTNSTKSTIDDSPSFDNETASKSDETTLNNAIASLNYANGSTGSYNLTDTQSNHSSSNTTVNHIRRLDLKNRTLSDVVLRDNAATVDEDGPQMYLSKVLNPPDDLISKNIKVNSTQSHSSKNVTQETFLDQSNGTSLFFNGTQISGNPALSGGLQNSFEKLGDSESSEEVFIYLEQNHTEVIKTTTVKTKSHNWTYDGTHQKVQIPLPDHMVKYVQEQTTPAPKKIRRVVFRQKPLKGLGIKARRKKKYNPLVTNGLPFSPRGLNPLMSPRGSRPVSMEAVSEEEELLNKPIVIGVPRPDFSDYELYVLRDESHHSDIDEIKANEYEYVSYKDPYIDIQQNDDFTQSGPNVKMYFIAAEEVEWDYGGSGQKRQERSQLSSRHTKFKKVVFRGYLDGLFRIPEIRGEKEEHLGILGPLIKAEYGQSIMVVFRNKANRPFSLHPNGVSYTKHTEGLSYEDNSTASYKGDNEVQPNSTYTYIWKVPRKADHTPDEPHCRTWTYYSGVNPEKDIHSGLIGPLLVCPKGTLNNMKDTSEFTLLFMTFDESQSWYYETNSEIVQRVNRRRYQDPNVKEDLKFHSINGITHNLKGLRMYTKQLVRWHLINMGSPKDFQSIHFHGQTFLHQQATSNRHGVFPLLPGSFATLEMYPSKPGLWQLETEIGINQQRGMQTLFLVLDNDCYRPLGLESGSVKDVQITANITRGYWEPHLARLNNKGKYNAWSTDQYNSFIQVDFQRPVVISQVATQGAKQLFHSQFVTNYSISYSNDRRRWSVYKGESRYPVKVFAGNQEAYQTTTNTLFPPVIARFIRLHPLQWYSAATVRMEYYGCELDGCSVPLGMENGLIEDQSITASSTSSNWYLGLWLPSYARLNKQGTVNAWQAKYKDMKQWLQVELPEVKKITGIITQGAKSLGKEMYVTFYVLQYSDDGIRWNDYSEDEEQLPRIFRGNDDNNEHVKNFIYPPIFSRFIRIVPRNWKGSITMRVELLGCDFE
nr:venom prothrombin activator pseutarin-C non-catalytic subunit-like isoform X1 [Nerophis lumbriciformis]